MKIKFFCDFTSSQNVINNFTVEKKTTYFTTGDDFTHAILLNTAMPNLTIPKENVVGLAFEPRCFLDITHEFVEYAKKHVKLYYIGDAKNLPLPFVEHHGFLWHSPLNSINFKCKLMSIIISNKKVTEGHIYRHKITQWIYENDLPIDIYGFGSNQFNGMGYFDDYTPYTNYFFSICIENTKCNEYFSEKISNALVNNCIPVYYGANNINRYFEGQVIELIGDFTEDTNLIKRILLNPSNYLVEIKSEENAKKLNLIEHLPLIFK